MQVLLLTMVGVIVLFCILCDLVVCCLLSCSVGIVLCCCFLFGFDCGIPVVFGFAVVVCCFACGIVAWV